MNSGLLGFSGGWLLTLSVIVGLIAGGLFGVQPSVNGHLSRHLQHPFQASLISFASGTVILIVMAITAGIFPPRFMTSPASLPWWAWGGGLIGVFMVTSSLILVPKVGSLPWFAAIMTGQVIAAVLLDHFGWLGNDRVVASPTRLAGAALLIAGLMLIVFAKSRENSAVDATSASSTSINE